MSPKKEIFIRYREGYFQILTYLSSAYEVFRYIEDRKFDSKVEIHLTNSFWAIVNYSLLNEIILNLVKLYENRKDSKCLFRFLRFCLSNPFIFEKNESLLKEWRIQKITTNIIKDDIAVLERIETITKNLKEWRDKSIAHIDGKYMRKPEILMEEYPIKYEELTLAIKTAFNIVNKYSIAFDGQNNNYIPSDINSIEKIFEILKLYNNHHDILNPLLREELKKESFSTLKFKNKL